MQQIIIRENYNLGENIIPLILPSKIWTWDLNLKFKT